MTCKGICEELKARRPVSGGRYEKGQKRCQLCAIFMETKNLHCPCCGYRLRSKPRGTKWKERFEKKNGIKRL